jgi:hypothetical protein
VLAPAACLFCLKQQHITSLVPRTLAKYFVIRRTISFGYTRLYWSVNLFLSYNPFAKYQNVYPTTDHEGSEGE